MKRTPEVHNQPTAGRRHVAFAFHPAAHYRGALIRELDQSPRFDYTFFFDDEGSRDPQLMMKGNGLKRFVRTKIRVFKGVLWQSRVVGATTRTRFDAVVATGDVHDSSTWILLLTQRFKGVPVLLWTQGWRRPESGLKGAIRVLFYKLSAGLLLYGERAKRLGEASGFPAERMHVIYNSVSPAPVSRDDKVGRRILQDTERRYILFCSRVKPAKRLDLLIEAVGLIGAHDEECRLVVVGDGDALEPARRQAQELGIDAHFLGAVHDADRLAAIHADAIAVVIPAHAGLAVTQALQFGKPVIVDDDIDGNGPECEAVLPGVTGLVYSHGSAKSLANSILRVQREFPSGSVAIGAQEIVERYTARSQCERIEFALGQVV